MSGSGFGSYPWGEFPWGADITDLFEVSQAVATGFNKVEVTFSRQLLADAVVSDPSSYSIDKGIKVLGAELISASVVRLFVSKMVYLTQYTVTVVGNVVDSLSNSLVHNTASFVGPDTAKVFVVSELEARSMCIGHAIRLSWVNPSGTKQVKILRSTKNWPLDLTDPHEVIYHGGAISSFEDTGVAGPVGTVVSTSFAGGVTSIQCAEILSPSIVTGFKPLPAEMKIESMNGEREFHLATLRLDSPHVLAIDGELPFPVRAGFRVSRHSPLVGQTYYYYTVLVSTADFDFSVSTNTPTVFDIHTESRTLGLSIEPFGGEQWLWDKVPRDYRRLDGVAVADGGGGGLLRKWIGVMGCWLETLHGTASATQLLADDDSAPYHMLPQKIASLGNTPDEGENSYDLSVMRRALVSLVPAYQKRGTCPGFQDIARIYGEWDTTCVNLGDAREWSGASNLRTYDGESLTEFGTATEATLIQSLANKALSIPGKSWDESLWSRGTVRGCMGEVLLVESNTFDTLKITQGPVVTTLVANAASGATILDLASTAFMLAGLSIQVELADGTAGEVVDIVSVGSGSITLSRPTQRAYPAGSTVHLGLSLLRFEIVSSMTRVSSGVMRDAGAKWNTAQWDGYKVMDSTGVIRTVLATSSPNQLILDGDITTGSYALAKDFQGASFADRRPVLSFRLNQGDHSYLFDPVREMALRGTKYDPFFYLWQGTGAAAQGSWGRYDIGIYVLNPILQTFGRYVGGSSTTLTADPASPPLVPDALVGMFLNPNQNQERLFEIVANTANSITVAGDVTGVAVLGQIYYVLTDRDSKKFQRVSARLREFANEQMNPHVLFL